MIKQVKDSPVLLSMFGDAPDADRPLTLKLATKDDAEVTLHEENICGGFSHYINPHWERNTRGQLMYVVNQPEGHTELTQLVRVTTCARAGEKCHSGSWFKSHGSECKQEYTEHKLVAWSADNSRVVIDTFRFVNHMYIREHYVNIFFL